MSTELRIAAAGTLHDQIPDGTHQIVLLTANYWGVGPDLATAKRKLKEQGVSLNWGYVMYAFPKGITFEGVHPVDGSVSWTFDDDTIPADRQPQPAKVGVRGTKTRF